MKGKSCKDLFTYLQFGKLKHQLRMSHHNKIMCKRKLQVSCKNSIKSSSKSKGIVKEGAISSSLQELPDEKVDPENPTLEGLNLDQQIPEMPQNEPEAICTVCMEAPITPMRTACQHIFCLKCIDKAVCYSSHCPCCRQNIRPTLYRYAQELEERLRRSSSQKNQGYRARYREHKQWYHRRRLSLSPIYVGQFIDYRSPDYKWMHAEVRQIKGDKLTVRVFNNELYTTREESHEINSEKLSSFRVHSKAIEIGHLNQGTKACKFYCTYVKARLVNLCHISNQAQDQDEVKELGHLLANLKSMYPECRRRIKSMDRIFCQLAERTTIQVTISYSLTQQIGQVAEVIF